MRLKKLKVGGIAVYVGSPVGPNGSIRGGDRVRVVRIIGSAVRIIPASAPVPTKLAMRDAFAELGVGVDSAFLVPVDDDGVQWAKR